MGALIVCTHGRPIGPEASMRYLRAQEERHRASSQGAAHHGHRSRNAAAPPAATDRDRGPPRVGGQPGGRAGGEADAAGARRLRAQATWTPDAHYRLTAW